MKRKLIMFILATIFIAVSISRASKIDRMQKIVDVAIGKYHTLCLFEDGRILAFGDNENGELGLGEFFLGERYVSPFYIQAPIKFVSIASGYFHSLAVSEDGTLWGWGDNSSCQLINSERNFSKSCTESEYNIPVIIDSEKDWRKVFADGFDSFGLKKDGTLWRISDMCQIENPKGRKWKNVIVQADGGGDDYKLYVMLEDKNGEIFTYGTCNEERNMLSCFSVWSSKKDGLKVLLPLETPPEISDLWMNDFSGVFRKRNEIHIWGMIATEENEIKEKFKSMFSDIRKSEEIFADWMFKSKKKVKIKKIKKIISGNFMWSFACIGGAEFNYSYTACLRNDGKLIVWSNGKTYTSDSSLKIRDIWGNNGIFAQAKDGKIYVTGYNLFNRLGVDKSQEEFLFLELFDF